MAESIVYMCLVGAAGLMAITGSTYVFAYVADKLCSSPYATERIFSPVSNRANLYGMSAKDRAEVLEEVFRQKKTIRKYNGAKIKNASVGEKLPVEIEMTDLEAKAKSQQPALERQATESESTSSGGDVESPETNAEDRSSHAALHGQELIPDQPTNMCSICLAEFENEDKVATGTQCSHLYHFSCIMEWMQKGQDHCPFCRVTMMTPHEMHAAALQVLGPRAVQQLGRPDMEGPVNTASALPGDGQMADSVPVAVAQNVGSIEGVQAASMQASGEAGLERSEAGEKAKTTQPTQNIVHSSEHTV